MIHAPSRYARLVRVLVPFAAFCGLAYLFIVTFIPTHIAPTKLERGRDQALREESVAPQLPLEFDPLGHVDRVLAEDPQKSWSSGVDPSLLNEVNGEAVSNEDEAIETVKGPSRRFRHYHHQGIASQGESANYTAEYLPDDANAMELEDEHDDDDDNNDGAGDKGSSLLGTVPDLERHYHDDIPYDRSYNESERANGVLVMIIYSNQLQSARETIRQIQDRFNRNRRYPWLILSPLPLSPRSQRHIQDLTKESTMTFGTIPHEHWRLPTWIEAGRVRNGDYAKMKYGMNKTSLTVRHKWRYASGFLAQHPLLDSYEIFWRIDPGVDIYCDLEEDPMLALAKSGKKFGWSLSSTANEAGIPDAWSIIQKFRTEFPQLIPDANDESFLTKGSGDAFSGCTYGVQNSIARLDFLRSPAYLSYFTFIDQDGPIYYHKWDDATVITIGLSLLAPRTDQLFLTQLGWGFLDSSSSVAYCPQEKCLCDLQLNNKPLHLSCTPFWMGHVAQSPEMMRRLECGESGKCKLYVSKPTQHVIAS